VRNAEGVREAEELLAYVGPRPNFGLLYLALVVLVAFGAHEDGQ
jgi:hypothetical protein